MALIRSADTIRTYNKAFATLDDADIIPYVSDAEEKYLKKYLGKTLYAALDTYIDDGESGDDEYDALLPHARKASSRFTLLSASPMLDINVGATGFTTTNTGTMVPASTDRVKRFTAGLEILGWDNVETMLKFLEENSDDYPLWVASDAYTLATENIIKTSEEFDKYVVLSVNRLLFTMFKKQMDNVEKLILVRILPQTLIDEIKTELLDDDLSEANEAIIEYIRYAIANYTVANILNASSEYGDTSFTLALKAQKREEYESLGAKYLMEIQKVLDENYDDYPLYTASDYYDEDKENNDMYENEEDDKVIALGAIPIK